MLSARGAGRGAAPVKFAESEPITPVMAALLLSPLVPLLALCAVQVRRRVTAPASELRRVFAMAPIGTIVLDEHDGIVRANAAMGRLVGCPEDALAGRTLVQLLHPDDLALLRIAFAQLRHGVCPELGTEVRLLRSDGVRADASLHATPLRAGRGRQHVLVQLLDVSERKRAEARLRHLAEHDALTGLPNRRRFARELDRHVAHARRYGAEGAVIVLDVDHFKQINDRGGHEAGDRLLAHVADTLRARLRDTDVLARLGGDEFAILLPRGDRAAAGAVARSLVATIHEGRAGHRERRRRDGRGRRSGRTRGDRRRRRPRAVRGEGRRPRHARVRPRAAPRGRRVAISRRPR
jgi:diguanylate cyclase (GGDEF)-like protein/PAS domain S-box-containing protein